MPNNLDIVALSCPSSIFHTSCHHIYNIAYSNPPSSKQTKKMVLEWKWKILTKEGSIINKRSI
jgi:hypothetical protein